MTIFKDIIFFKTFKYLLFFISPAKVAGIIFFGIIHFLS